MFKILEAEQLSANVYKQVILAPRVAKSCEPGQFIILRVDENGERIPLTICDYDREAGTVTIVFLNGFMTMVSSAISSLEQEAKTS